MSHIQAIYKNGVLLPLAPLDLEENTVVELDVHDGNGHIEQSGKNENRIRAFEEWMESLNPNIPSLTDEQISRENIYEEQIKRQL